MGFHSGVTLNHYAQAMSHVKDDWEIGTTVKQMDTIYAKNVVTKQM